MAKKFTPKTPEQIQAELDELTVRVEGRIENYFESKEAIIEHLRFMSQFHDYSLRNMMLIDDQFEGARAVGSYAFWNSKGVQVKKGEKGIKILVPAPVTYFERDDKLVQLKFATPAEKELIDRGQLKTQTKTFFKIGHVFEYSQTNAREMGLEVSEIFGQFQINHNLENGKEFMQALEKVASEQGVKILREPYSELGTAKGAFYPFMNTIALNPRNTEAENVHVMIHELAHAAMHNIDRIKGREKALSTAEKEFQAELTAYVVAARYGIEVENFSIPYLANWTKYSTLQEKELLLKEVKETASKFITTMDSELQTLFNSREHEKELLEKEPITQVNVVDFGSGTQIPAKMLSLDVKELQAYLVEKAGEQPEKLEQIDSIFSNNSLSESHLEEVNTMFGRQLHVFNPTDINEPQVVIFWSEHNVFKDNSMVRFAEANHLAYEAGRNVDVEKEGYAKTKYGVVIPSDSELRFIQPDRIDLGDGHYTDMLNQLIRESRAKVFEMPPEQLSVLEDDIKSFYQDKTASYSLNEIETLQPNSTFEKQLALDATVLKNHFGTELPYPVIKVEGMNEFIEFGKGNQADFSEQKGTYNYTIAFEHNGQIELMNSSLYMNQVFSPLHDLEKFEKLPADMTEILSENWHSVLQKEEDLYLQQVMPRIRQELNKSEGIEKTEQKEKTKVQRAKRTKELER